MKASAVLADLERQLKEVWVTEPGERARTRVCTMNLVVVAPAGELAESYAQVVDEVTASIPARAILVTLDMEGGTAHLEGDVSAVCGVGEDATCSERVRLRARGAACERMGSVVDTLLVPELPTALVWLGRVHVEDPIFTALAASAQRVIVDTQYAPVADLVALDVWSRGDPSRPAAADLAWTRLTLWLEMCARLFDEPRVEAHASAIHKIALGQADGARLSSEPALLLGWMASRLDWKVQRVGGKVRLVRPDGVPVQLELTSGGRPGASPPGMLTTFLVESQVDGMVCQGEIARRFDAGGGSDMLAWRLQADTPSAFEQQVRIKSGSGARVLERTLRRPRRDDLLAASALVAQHIEEEGLKLS